MHSAIDSLIDAQPPGWSLPRAFYRDAAIFELDVERIFKRRWLLVDHASRIPARGDYFLFEIAGASIIIVRDQAGQICAYYNVCRHRGSRICLGSSGHAARFTCPYHTWTYGLDGRLLTARQMPPDFDRGQFSLRRCGVEVVEGLIFVSLDAAASMDFAPARSAITAFLQLHGIATARIAFRESFRTAANWKLVLENFLECYHCLPTHPEYCAVNSVVKLIGDGSTSASAQYMNFWERWRSQSDPAFLALERVSSAPASESFNLRNPYAVSHGSVRAGAEPSTVFAAMRTPINEGFLTMSQDGTPLAPLMGRFESYDGGKTSVNVDYVGRMTAANDYAVLFRFIPVSPQITDFEIIWLVRGDAVEGKDYDLNRLRWLWRVTTLQDKVLAENNQLGVNSRAYAVGPYSLLEDGPRQFVEWYLEQIDQRLDATPRGSRPALSPQPRPE